MKRHFIVILMLGWALESSAQVFIPMAFWRAKKNLTLSCVSGCYPTPDTEFSALLYYIPRTETATFKAVSLSNPNHDFCFGPTVAGGCLSDPIGNDSYPLQCAGPGNGDIDGSGSANADEADYTAPDASTTDTCWVTDFAEGRAAVSASIRVFNPVVISAPVTTISSPVNVCVSQTQAFAGSGGLGTLTWSVVSGAGSFSPLTGTTSTFTAPASAQQVQVRLIDSTTSMPAFGYVNVISTVSLSPSNVVETPVNSSTFMQNPTSSAGTTFVANLNFTANCGLPTYSVSCIGGGSVSPVAGVGNNVNVRYTPNSSESTSTVTFSDSTLPTAQSASQTVYNIVPVDVVGSWGYHVCVTYSHSTYSAGTYKLKCWGYNNNGQLGYGDTNARGNAAAELGVGLAFVKDTGTTGSDMMVKDVSVGFNHTCAILSNDSVKCWGLNSSGQLGYDNATQLASPSASTVYIGAGTPKKLYASGYKTCLVFSDDRLKCWGRNTYGELGQDNNTNYGSNGTTASMSLLNYVSVAGSNVTVMRVAGTINQTCVLTTASFVPGVQSVYCWGLGNSGGNACSNTSNRYWEITGETEQI